MERNVTVDLVIEGFRKLMKKCNSHGHFTSAREDLSTDQPGMELDAALQLHLWTLPELRRQIVTILDLLDPHKFLKDPGSRLRLILEIQSELSHTLDRIIIYAIHILCPLPIYSPSGRRDDQHLQECKQFRLRGLHDHLTQALLRAINIVCYESDFLIQQLILSTDTKDGDSHVALSRKCLLLRESPLMTSIESGIEWLKGSDFDIVQIGWSKEVLGYNKSLETILDLVDKTINSTKRNNGRQTKKIDKFVIQLAKLAIIIIKLLRPFFNKLSVRGMNRKRLPMFSKMCSEDLNTVAQVAVNRGGELHQMAGMLKGAQSATALICRQLTETIQNIDAYTTESLLLILTYFLPLIPDTNGCPTQNYYRAWFDTWKTLFTIANNNFLHAVQVLQSNGL
ncbi:hypothetical protein MJO28_008972 [Puccinia striiformis f. sp. tritici]|uniref:Uncharacterized protein n=1 Tax=Puccinia striiformis f. sp. tritici TaxID=168172 RepID=A0ACC0EE69_9BASI|nr:hypothetical protein MJO28_008972 [Puccinia striiformis f. sp. tritici]